MVLDGWIPELWSQLDFLFDALYNIGFDEARSFPDLTVLDFIYVLFDLGLD